MAFSENLQFLRARANMTQEQLAEELDVSRQSVSKWESGASFPEMDTLLRICDRYGVDLDTLLRGSVENTLVSDTVQYDKTMNRFTRQVTCSIGAIIATLGVVVLLVFAGLSEMLAGALFLLVVTISVVVLVAGGIQYDDFCKKHPVIPDFYTQEERDAFHRKFVWLIAGGVGAILFGLVLMVLFFSVFPEEEPYESLAGAVFLWIVAGAVCAFIYAGMQEDKYNIAKYNRENTPDPEVKKRNGVIGALCGCIMLAATAVYVGLGLAKDLWIPPGGSSPWAASSAASQPLL